MAESHIFMNLLINKDGKQLGPYSLDETRALVLSGQLEADDWAWPDGGTKWIPLKEVPGFAPAIPGAAAPTSPLAPPNAEEELWRGHPSQMLNFPVYFIWTIVLLAVLASTLISPWGLVFFGGLAVIALIQCAICYFHRRSIEYVVTTQRVRVLSGIFSKDIQEIELFRVKDTMAHQSFFLRLAGLGTITILSGDERNPNIVLSGIPRALELRERLRQEIMALRQRFGVREVDVM
jgi:membrane protein YdbS with pleckstrin-like domain